MIASHRLRQAATRLAVAFVAIVGAGASGRAADIPVKAPAAVVVPSWSGFYIGSHAGGAWGLNGDVSAVTLTTAPVVTDPFFSGRKTDFGVVTGAHAGFNWQTASWLLGVEVDFSLASLRNDFRSGTLTSAGAPLPAGNHVLMHTDLNWLASARGRVGHTWDKWLVYVTGGAAWANITYSAVRHYAAIPPNNITSSSRTDAGWVAGGGGEYALSANWMVRTEYLYYHIKASRSVTTTCGPAGCGATPPVIAYTWRPNEVHVARVGLSYKFQP